MPTENKEAAGREQARPAETAALLSDDSIRRSQFRLFAVGGVLVEVGFGLTDLFQGKFLLFSVLMLSALPLAAGALLINGIRNPKPFYRLSTLMAALACLALTFAGGQHGSKMLWTFVAPLFMFFLFDHIEGAAWTAALYLLTLLIMSSPALFPGAHEYPPEFVRRFAGCYPFVAVAAWWYEFQRYHHRTTLSATNAGLAAGQAALVDSEHKYRLLFGNMSSAFALLETVPAGGRQADYRFLEINAAFERLTGLRARETEGRPLSGLLDEGDAWLVETIRRAGESGRPERAEGLSSWLGKYLEISVYSSSPGRLALLCEDISERRHTEQERIKAQRMESIATLAGGIAHDFNNILTGVLGNISMVRTELSVAASGLPQVLIEAENAAVRAKDLARQLLTFSKGGRPAKKALDIGPLIREAAAFVLRGSPSRCETDLPPDLRTIMADPGQIAQVFHNLLINAAQSMPGGGVIRVTGRNISLPPGGDGPAGNLVAITVSDSGPGIAPENMARLFEPYFSTKADGRGLGLSMAHSIIGGHGGAISAVSEPGKGASFTIRLPAAEVPAVDAQAHAKSEPPKPAVRGSGRILVMDDDAIVQKACSRMLTALGYDCSIAPDGRSAIEEYKRAAEAGKPFIVVIMDLTVPGGMGGKEAVVELKRLDPKAKALVSSGYSDDPVIGNYKDFGFDAVLTKPYRFEELAKVLEDMQKAE